jgi:hypothetical protein
VTRALYLIQLAKTVPEYIRPISALVTLKRWEASIYIIGTRHKEEHGKCDHKKYEQ